MKLTYVVLYELHKQLMDNIANRDSASNMKDRSYFEGKVFALVECVAEIEETSWGDAYDILFNPARVMEIAA